MASKAIVMQRYASHSIICLLASRCVDAAGASVFNCIHTLMTINAEVLASIDRRGPWAWGLLEACSQKFTTPNYCLGWMSALAPAQRKSTGYSQHVPKFGHKLGFSAPVPAILAKPGPGKIPAPV